jgi:diguanylate cyclase
MTKESIRYRLRNDFQLAVISLMAAVALVGLIPFGLWRAINGQWLLFAMDAVILAGIAGNVAYAWWTGNTRAPSLFAAYFLCIMTQVAIHLLGETGRYWLYPQIIASFFLVRRRHAAVISLASLAALPLTGTGFGTGFEATSFLATITVSAMFTYAFAHRVELQREQLETLAALDPLTGIRNRRTLIDDLERAHAVFRRERRPCAVLILDLDHFKDVNDQYGHMAGDRVLIALTRLVEQNIRKGDQLYRFGGEEFVVMAPAVCHAGLTVIAEKLRRKVADNLVAPDGRPITISIGGSLLRADESPADWFARADTSLYVAKNAGRNQSVIDHDEPAATSDIPPPAPAA